MSQKQMYSRHEGRDRYRLVGAPAMASSGSAATAAVQASLVVLLMTWLLLTPPVEGRMMLVPLDAAASAALPALVLRDGTRLIGTGPIGGSLIVYGRRARLVHLLLGYGILTVATPSGGCAQEGAA